VRVRHTATVGGIVIRYRAGSSRDLIHRAGHWRPRSYGALFGVLVGFVAWGTLRNVRSAGLNTSYPQRSAGVGAACQPGCQTVAV
jgi:hypothetical protein